MLKKVQKSLFYLVTVNQIKTNTEKQTVYVYIYDTKARQKLNQLSYTTPFTDVNKKSLLRNLFLSQFDYCRLDACSTLD